MKRFLISAVTLCLFSANAFALGNSADKNDKAKADGKERKPRYEKIFERNDANQDGTVTKEEFMKAQTPRFDRMDGNHDGKLTKEEAKSFSEEQRKKREANQR